MCVCVRAHVCVGGGGKKHNTNLKAYEFLINTINF